jgi:hypothetical protein
MMSAALTKARTNRRKDTSPPHVFAVVSRVLVIEKGPDCFARPALYFLAHARQPMTDQAIMLSEEDAVLVAAMAERLGGGSSEGFGTCSPR